MKLLRARHIEVLPDGRSRVHAVLLERAERRVQPDAILSCFEFILELGESLEDKALDYTQ